MPIRSHLLAAASFDPHAYHVPYGLLLRNSASAYLSKTYGGSPATRKVVTLSIWFKRGDLGRQQSLFDNRQGDGSDTTGLYVGFNASDQLELKGGTTVFRLSKAKYRCTQSWNHLSVQINTGTAGTDSQVEITYNGLFIWAADWQTVNAFTSNQDLGWGAANAHYIGCRQGTNDFFNGVIAQVFFYHFSTGINAGVANDDVASNINAESWQPINVKARIQQGLYTLNNNAFFLEFLQDGTSAGVDTSGLGNDYTTNNIATGDRTLDTPTSNYCTLSAEIPPASGVNNFEDGGLRWDSSSGSPGAGGSYGFLTPFYFEAKLEGANLFSGSNGCIVGIQNALKERAATANLAGRDSAGIVCGSHADDGTVTTATVVTGVGTSHHDFVQNDIVMIAADPSRGILWIGFNGTWIGGSPSLTGTTGAFTSDITAGVPWRPWICSVGATAGGKDVVFSFGQKAFTYTPPAGFKELHCDNLPKVPTRLPVSQKAFSLYRYSASFHSSVVGFSIGLVWFKSYGAEHHKLVDYQRGAGKALSTSSTAAEVTETGVSNISGPILGSPLAGYNLSGMYLEMAWAKKTGSPDDTGFDVVSYTGDGANRNIAHPLGAAPEFIVVKDLDAANSWLAFHKDQVATNPQNNYLTMNTNAASAVLSTVWNNTAPTDTVFSVGTNVNINTNGNRYICYLWRSIPGFSKVGYYIGNGAADGPFVWCGFKPSWILIKRADSTGSWCVRWCQPSVSIAPDTVSAYSPTTEEFLAESSVAVQVGTELDFGSNGFKIRGTSTHWNASGGRYIFMAFARRPFGGPNVLPAVSYR